MQVKVSFRHIESTAPLQDYAIEKSQRIRKYLPDISPLKVDFILSVEHYRHIANVLVSAKKINFKAAGISTDLYAAIDMAIESLEKQLRRHKEKITHHKQFWKSSQAKLETAASLFDEKHLSVERDAKIVKGGSVAKRSKKEKKSRF